MGISRSISLQTDSSLDELRSALAIEVKRVGQSGPSYFVRGTESYVSADRSSPQYDWQCRFGVNYNTTIVVQFETGSWIEGASKTLDESYGPLLVAAGGSGWATHHDTPMMYWNPSEIVVNSAYWGHKDLEDSLRSVGLAYELVELDIDAGTPP